MCWGQRGRWVSYFETFALPPVSVRTLVVSSGVGGTAGGTSWIENNANQLNGNSV